MKQRVLASLALIFLAAASYGQVTSGSILGSVMDPSGALIAGARVTARNMDTNGTQEFRTTGDGRFRFPQLSVGSYEVTVEAPGFGKYSQGPIVLRLNEAADLTIRLALTGVTESVNVNADAPLINTTNAEIGVNFDQHRIENLPIAPNRNIFNLALSVAGVSQLSSGNSTFADGGVSFSVNGARTRSNNFMLDGGDINQPSIGGSTQQINNPDTVGEFRLITNQFLAEYGRSAGSVVNVITKSGSNTFHGTTYWTNNNNHFNSRSNLDKKNFKESPYRNENQFAGTFGGRIIKDKTFFFVSALRWTDRAFVSGTSIGGAPTAAGDDLLRPLGATKPQVQALLNNLPPAQVATSSVNAVINGQTVQIPVGTLSGAAPNTLNVWQWSARGDHRFNDKESMFARYQWDDRTTTNGQAVPAGLTSLIPERRQVAVAALNSTLSPNFFNEVRLSFNRFLTATTASNQNALSIPDIEISQLGLVGFNAASSRTALGFALNLPQSATYNSYQLVETASYIRGSHSMKAGIDFRRQDQYTVFNPTLRGRLSYGTLQNFIDDLAQVATINTPLQGVPTTQYYTYYDYFFFVQDEWRVKPNFTLTYGLRYESPGNAFSFLKKLNDKVVSNNGGNPDFSMGPVPARDTNNFAPRFGFNYRFGKGPGPLGWLTGDGKMVVRGGYSRTYDLIFNNMALNVFSSFPFTLVVSPSTVKQADGTSLIPNAFATIDPIRAGKVIPPVIDPAHITRTQADSTFRSPLSEQFSVGIQRELSNQWAMTLGWVGTKGTALFDSVDGNPTIPGTSGLQRVNPNRGVIRLRANVGSSIYHSLQTSVEKRLSRNFSMAAHYTWSAFIDNGSEVFNASTSGEVAVAQDSYNRAADRGRSTYDRPHRFVVNGVYELPFFSEQKGLVGHAVGGWQVGGFLTLQSGSPFSALAGIDPGNRLTGIDSLIGNAIRPFVNPGVSLNGVTVEDLYRNGANSYFTEVTKANPIGNAGRNILRSAGIQDLDLSIVKNLRMPWENHRLQYKLEMYNTLNHRNFGIPNASVNSPAFANQWNTDGGNRRIVMGLRYQF